MKPLAILVVAGWIASASSLPPRSPEIGGNPAPPANVNSRYTVESVELSPASVRLSSRLRGRIDGLAGGRFDQETVDSLVAALRAELRGRSVVMRLARGADPERIRVIFDIEKKEALEVVVPRLVYHSKQNFTFGGDLNVHAGSFVLIGGVLTDNERLVERYSGVRGGIRREGLFSDRLRLEFTAENWRSQWNGATTSALAENADVPGIYRSRLALLPSATILFSRDLTLQLGVSMQRVETQFPSTRHELSSAANSTLRFRRRWEDSPGGRHETGASYGLTASTRSLASDFIYTRHAVQANYSWTSGANSISVAVHGGLLNGRAPVFERFTLGGSTTLRGWNRFDLAPFGGDRVGHASLDVRHGPFRAVYDTGAVWKRSGPAILRHSVAVGITAGSVTALSFLVAFPLRDGRVEPIFITGINF